MSVMIERVARALFSCSVYHGYDDATLEREWQRTAGLHRKAARVAIEAMRVPSEDMIAAANRNNHPRDIDTWRTMIETALSPLAKATP